MATLDALYTRIILDLDRDDMDASDALEQAKIDAVADSIAQYKLERFWFNRANGTGNTSADTATIAMPSGVYVPEVVAYDGEPLLRVPLHQIQHRDETGVPTHWAENEETIQLWPIPDAVYTISVYGSADIDAPGAGASSNIWTTEAYNLILNAAKRILTEGPLRDSGGATMAYAAEQRALAALKRETARRWKAPLKTDVPQRHETFSINRGW